MHFASYAVRSSSQMDSQNECYRSQLFKFVCIRVRATKRATKKQARELYNQATHISSIKATTILEMTR